MTKDQHQTHSEIARRLKRASGHLTKVITMIETGKPCLEVSQQLQAVVKAIANAKRTFVQDHIEHCINLGEQGDSVDPGRVQGSRNARLSRRARELREISKYL